MNTQDKNLSWFKKAAYWAGFGSQHKETQAAFDKFDAVMSEAEAFLKSQDNQPSPEK